MYQRANKHAVNKIFNEQGFEGTITAFDKLKLAKTKVMLSCVGTRSSKPALND